MGAGMNNLSVISAGQLVCNNGEMAKLTKNEFNVFYELFKAKGKKVSREEIYREAFNKQLNVRNIDVHVFNARDNPKIFQKKHPQTPNPRTHRRLAIKFFPGNATVPVAFESFHISSIDRIYDIYSGEKPAMFKNALVIPPYHFYWLQAR